VKFNFAGNSSPKPVGNLLKKSFTSFEGSLQMKNQEKPQIQARNSTFIDKKLANMPSYQINKILNRRKMSLAGEGCLAKSLFHRNFNHLRRLPHFRVNAPKISLLDGNFLFFEREIRNLMRKFENN